jgi:protein MPE1
VVGYVVLLNELSQTCPLPLRIVHMSSAVYYRFKSQKTESRIPIDGTGISVFDLKREIILANGLDKVLDIDLRIYNQSADEG